MLPNSLFKKNEKVSSSQVNKGIKKVTVSDKLKSSTSKEISKINNPLAVSAKLYGSNPLKSNIPDDLRKSKDIDNYYSNTEATVTPVVVTTENKKRSFDITVKKNTVGNETKSGFKKFDNSSKKLELNPKFLGTKHNNDSKININTNETNYRKTNTIINNTNNTNMRMTFSANKNLNEREREREKSIEIKDKHDDDKVIDSEYTNLAAFSNFSTNENNKQKNSNSNDMVKEKPYSHNNLNNIKSPRISNNIPMPKVINSTPQVNPNNLPDNINNKINNIVQAQRATITRENVIKNLSEKINVKKFHSAKETVHINTNTNITNNNNINTNLNNNNNLNTNTNTNNTNTNNNNNNTTSTNIINNTKTKTIEKQNEKQQEKHQDKQQSANKIQKELQNNLHEEKIQNEILKSISNFAVLIKSQYNQIFSEKLSTPKVEDKKAEIIRKKLDEYNNILKKKNEPINELSLFNNKEIHYVNKKHKTGFSIDSDIKLPPNLLPQIKDSLPIPLKERIINDIYENSDLRLKRYNVIFESINENLKHMLQLIDCNDNNDINNEIKDNNSNNTINTIIDRSSRHDKTIDFSSVNIQNVDDLNFFKSSKNSTSIITIKKDIYPMLSPSNKMLLYNLHNLKDSFFDLNDSELNDQKIKLKNCKHKKSLSRPTNFINVSPVISSVHFNDLNKNFIDDSHNLPNFDLAKNTNSNYLHHNLSRDMESFNLDTSQIHNLDNKFSIKENSFIEKGESTIIFKDMKGESTIVYNELDGTIVECDLDKTKENYIINKPKRHITDKKTRNIYTILENVNKSKSKHTKNEKSNSSKKLDYWVVAENVPKEKEKLKESINKADEKNGMCMVF